MTPYEFGYVDGLESPHDLVVGRTWDSNDPFAGDQSVDPNDEYDRGVNDGQASQSGRDVNG